MQDDTINGLVEAANTANGTEVVVSKAQRSRRDQGKETAQKANTANTANTANDKRANLQIAATSDGYLTNCGIAVYAWQGRDPDTNQLVLMRSMYNVVLCKCGNYYVEGDFCGICDKANTAKNRGDK